MPLCILYTITIIYNRTRSHCQRVVLNSCYNILNTFCALELFISARLPSSALFFSTLPLLFFYHVLCFLCLCASIFVRSIFSVSFSFVQIPCHHFFPLWLRWLFTLFVHGKTLPFFFIFRSNAIFRAHFHLVCALQYHLYTFRHPIRDPFLWP